MGERKVTEIPGLPLMHQDDGSDSFLCATVAPLATADTAPERNAKPAASGTFVEHASRW